MSFALQPFLAAMTAGQQINVDMDAKRASTAAQMQSIAFNQQKMDMAKTQQAQQQASAQAMQGLLEKAETERQQRQVDNGEAPDIAAEHDLQAQSDTFRKMGALALATDPEGAQKWFDKADAKIKEIGPLRVQNLEIANKKQEQVSAFAGSVLDGSADPKTAFEFVKANMGLPAAMQMPTDPTSPEYKNYWKSQQTKGVKAQEQITNSRNIEKDKFEREKAKKEAEDREAERQEKRQDRALEREARSAARTSAAEAKADRDADRASAGDMRATEGLNKRLEKTAKPLLEDRARLDAIDGLLAANSSEADQQLHQSLTAMMGNFKGRATNLFYKDNKNFGSAMERLNDVLSHGFTGRYSEGSRLAIQKMVRDVRDGVVDPSLTALESRMKEHAKGYKLNPDQVEINADFNRGDGSGKPAAAAPRADYGEGQVAVNKQTGQTLVFTNGQWVEKK